MSQEIMDVRMKAADNGVVICYNMRSPMGGRTFDYTIMEHKEVYEFKAGSNSEKLNAINRFMELSMQSGEYGGMGEMEEEGEMGGEGEEEGDD